MMTNKVIHSVRSYMAHQKRRGGRRATLDQLSIKMISVDDSESESTERRKCVQKILTLMYQNLRKKGRPTRQIVKGKYNAV